jgi:hypothetical protein
MAQITGNGVPENNGVWERSKGSGLFDSKYKFDYNGFVPRK